MAVGKGALSYQSWSYNALPCCAGERIAIGTLGGSVATGKGAHGYRGFVDKTYAWVRRVRASGGLGCASDLSS